ncbi:MAG: hypothetical protein ACOVSI_03035, partial [Gemmatimonas sp.]
RTPDTAGKIGHKLHSRPAILSPDRNFTPLPCRNPAPNQSHPTLDQRTERTQSMRYITGLALLFALSTTATSVAGDTPVHVLPATTAVKSVTVQPVSARRVTRSSKQTFFGKVMELERRKNAWLRRTFLGR